MLGVAFPRVCGVEPENGHIPADWPRFSPRTRGCSRVVCRLVGHVTIFPRTRGCSSYAASVYVRHKPFPAHAGLIPSRSSGRLRRCSFPRACGVVPDHRSQRKKYGNFSPRTRGCPVEHVYCIAGVEIFPAYVGLFRTWCPVAARLRAFPAHAGLILRHVPVSGPRRSFPRVRGVFLTMFSTRFWHLRRTDADAMQHPPRAARIWRGLLAPQRRPRPGRRSRARRGGR